MFKEVVDLETVAYFLAYDSTDGRFSHPVIIEKVGLRGADLFIGLSHETEPSNVAWGDRGVDIGIDCIGVEPMPRRRRTWAMVLAGYCSHSLLALIWMTHRYLGPQSQVVDD